MAAARDPQSDLFSGPLHHLTLTAVKKMLTDLHKTFQHKTLTTHVLTLVEEKSQKTLWRYTSHKHDLVISKAEEFYSIVLYICCYIDG